MLHTSPSKSWVRLQSSDSADFLGITTVMSLRNDIRFVKSGSFSHPVGIHV